MNFDRSSHARRGIRYLLTCPRRGQTGILNTCPRGGLPPFLAFRKRRVDAFRFSTCDKFAPWQICLVGLCADRVGPEKGNYRGSGSERYDIANGRLH